MKEIIQSFAKDIYNVLGNDAAYELKLELDNLLSNYRLSDNSFFIRKKSKIFS